MIAYLRRLGFDGLFAGGKHEFMIHARLRVRLPNPHRGDVGRDLLTRILLQAGVSREEWESL